ncbi:hypothetical protein SB6411_05509 [Klebsiella spallanzanii]|jgi:phage-related protein|uniref:Type II toxin-antitoxin system RelE/ParE family toxin n=1 Tax=Klebsiella spallanzanii TaxID=2587528 RepID=A0A564IBP5_9ENTR|nr:type II toxin-antitoxin system RelE/ParE family toxin [Klebsiella spallanzanii]MDM4210799.1 type II toxin-antitoxin system RelE/ParE family toxin [Klebsiella spallanzanii]VUS41743.1 hypothetical protein SB6411_05509 [Klebsiella spallanzanii]VUS56322.1 hypothetical protein SB6408_04707 [Klebsiella spallanzanii]
MLLQKREHKSIAWIGSSFEDLLSFPEDVRKDAGYQLHRLQAGLEAADWKPMSEIGRGVEEIRLRQTSGTFRIIYLSRFGNAVYVLHCFSKKTQRISDHDKRIARVRFQAVQQEHRSHK